MGNVYSNKYYIDKYVKCELCGKLVYEDTYPLKPEEKGTVPSYFCSEWCKNEYLSRKS